MKRSKLHIDELGARLRSEAEADSPQFSSLLHERIMQGLPSTSLSNRSLSRTAGREGDVAHSRPKRASYWWLSVAAATAAAIALALLLHNRTGGPVLLPARVQTPVAVRTLPAMPELGKVVTRLSDPATEHLQAARYAYLDQDAKRFTRYMFDQINVLSLPQ